MPLRGWKEDSARIKVWLFFSFPAVFERPSFPGGVKTQAGFTKD